MDPLTAATIAISVGSSLFAGVTGMQQANYQAQVAEMNAQIARDNAERAIDRSQIEQQNQDTLSLAMLGEQEVAQAASGLALTGRNFSKARVNARTLARQDALNIRQAGELEAYAYKTDAVNFEAQAQAKRMEGRASLLGGFLEAGGSLIGDANKVRDPNRYRRGSLLGARQ